MQNAQTGPWKIRARVDGGRLDTADGRIADAAGEFYGVTIAGDVALFDDENSSAAGALWVRDALTFDGGTLTIGPFAELNVNELITIDGRGAILLNGRPDRTRLQTYTGAMVTIGPDVIVKTGPTGGGTISRSTLPVVNLGTISAQTAGQTLVVDGALENAGTLQAINNSMLRINVDDWTNNGTMHVEDANILLASDSFANGPAGEITGNGEIQMATAALVNHGLISPGPAVGNLAIRGPIELQSMSRLLFELQGSANGHYDRLQVINGPLTVGGNVSVALLPGFRSRLGDQFEVLAATSISGSFANSQCEVRYGPYAFRIDVGSTSVVLTTVAVPEPGMAAIASAAAAAVVGWACRGPRKTRRATLSPAAPRGSGDAVGQHGLGALRSRYTSQPLESH